MSSVDRVAIVGAGIIGCAIAFELSQRGVEVVIFDGRHPAEGATQASAGILAPFIEAHQASALLHITSRSLTMYDAFVESLRARTDLPFEYRRSGTLEIAETAQRASALRSRAVEAGTERAQFEWIDAPQLRELEPSADPSHVGGLLCPVHGHIAVEPFVAGLIDAATHGGAAFHPREAVRDISLHADGITVRTDEGAYGAGHVVLSAGCWASTLDPLGEIALRVKPIRGQLVRLAWHPGRIRHVVWGECCYVVPWTDGTVLVGATSEDVGFDERATAGGVQELIAAASQLLPELRFATFLGVRVGLRPATDHGLPIIGPSARDPRVVYATGHFRNGILLAPLTAHAVAEFITSGRRDPALSVDGA